MRRRHCPYLCLLALAIAVLLGLGSHAPEAIAQPLAPGIEAAHAPTPMSGCGHCDGKPETIAAQCFAACAGLLIATLEEGSVLLGAATAPVPVTLDLGQGWLRPPDLHPPKRLV